MTGLETAGGSLASMTGQGAAHADVEGSPGTRVLAEIRSVNHRYFDPRVRASGVLADHAHAAEDVARKRLVRGRVEIALSLEGARPAPRLDVERAAAAFSQLVSLRDRVAPGEPVPLSLLASMPELFAEPAAGRDAEPLREAVIRATDHACTSVEQMRHREGDALRRDLERRLITLDELTAAIEARLPMVVSGARARLRERIARLLEPSAVSVDTSRLEHEIAIFADRSDVAEECTRLRAHLAEVRRVLRVSTEGRGKRLDFLCQELAREANTLGQKSADVEIGARVIDLKTEIERMREQAQNVL